ncbi:DNA polymerase-3 subunit alpha (Gram-positive type) [Caldicoprobacter guelmensis]|uniref:PolC-type DNA polymerase III n=1 Tax=Caldicoprobacter guelmensis TaxID=1170224 RepID=UPI00195DF07E|nr:PolC-type DNA polymerase III [Caldicoprobacter guelmensis]MBM7581421.1 DNA polymerase-3 subunit alpha (Gram-positive type) [Caldicoprobacter guelmensis]
MAGDSAKAFPLGKIVDGSFGAWIDKLSLIKAIVYKNQRKWDIYVNAESFVEPQRIRLLEQHIKEKFPELKQVRLKVVYKNNGGEILSRYFSHFWKGLVESMKDELPSLNGWLDYCTPQLSSDGLMLLLSHPAALDLFKIKKVDQYIKDWLFETFNQHIKVSMELVDGGQEWLDEEYFVEREKEDSLLVKEAVQINESPPKSSEQQGEVEQGEDNEIVILGKAIKDSPMPISQIQEGIEAVVIEGEVLEVEKRELKGEKVLFCIDVTDYTDSITTKAFCPKDKVSNMETAIKSGCWIRVKGSCRFDPFQREEILQASDIMLVSPKKRQDTYPEKRVELHLHTQMSAMDAVSPVTALIERAAQWGHPAIAITDHGVVQAFPEAHEASQQYGIKVIYGVEAYLINDCKPVVINPNDRDFNQPFVVLDIETTGLNPRKDEVTEIGAVKIVGRKVVDTFSCFVNPGIPIPRDIVKLTGITDEMVRDAPAIEEVLPGLLEFLGDAVLVAHNASFDLGFIKEKCRRIGARISNPILDTLLLSRELFKDIKRHSLDAVAQHINIPQERHHRALDDAKTAALILIHMLNMLEEKGASKLCHINTMFSHISNLNSLESYHAVILAQTQEGLINLYRLITKSHLDYFYRKPRIPKSVLVSHREGLIVGSGCDAGELYQAILKGVSDEELMDIALFYDYFEIQPLGNNEHLIREGRVKDVDALKEINRKIVKLGEKLGRPVVATGDVHFLDPHDEYYRRILMSCQGYEDAEQQAPLYFKTTDEMLNEFGYLGEEKAKEVVIYAPRAIADSIENIKPIPDELYTPEIPGAEENVRNMAINNAKAIYGDPLPPIVEERLNKELNAIINNGYAVLYWIAHKLVQKSLEDGYLVGSRGSVGSSFVATMTGITEVNPLPPHYVCPSCKHSDFEVDTSKYGCGVDLPDKNCPVCGTPYRKEGFDIPFEVFLGFNGDKVPDIDLNFSGEYQSTAHKYAEELLGRGNVFRAGTIATVAEKTAFGFVKKYLEEHNKVARNAEIKRLVRGCTGIKRTTGQHPGGVMVVPHKYDIHQFTPLQYPADDRESGVITTHFDYHSISSRLVKLDILGHDDPTVIRMLEDITGIDARSIPIGEERTMRIFSSTEPLGLSPEDINCEVGTFGIPEFGTRFVRQMLTETKPKTFSELVRISGLSHGTDVWLNNAQDLIRNGIAQLSEVISARDDIMIYLMYKGVEPVLSFKIMENVRKGKGLTPEQEQKMRENNVPEWYIESCKKIKYMFPKAHAVAYVIMAFRIAYFKVYYPEAFYATYFTVRADDFDVDTILKGKEAIARKIKEMDSRGNSLSMKEKNSLSVLEVALEMYARGIRLLPVDLYKSDAVKFLVTPEGIRMPFNALPGVGISAATSIVEARKCGKFVSIEDFRERAKVSKAVVEILKNYGCLNGLPETSQISFF